MNTVTITRHYNSFVNVSDTLTIGNDEYQGDAAATVYRLPEGYSVENGRVFDPAGNGGEVHLVDGKVTLLIKGSEMILEATE